MRLQLWKTYVRVITLDTADGAKHYQQTSQEFSATSGFIEVTSNVYILEKEALVENLPILTNGAIYIRIDMAKATDTTPGSDSTITTTISTFSFWRRNGAK